MNASSLKVSSHEPQTELGNSDSSFRAQDLGLRLSVFSASGVEGFCFRVPGLGFGV